LGDAELIKEIKDALIPAKRKCSCLKKLYTEQVDAFRNMSVEQIVNVLLDMGRARFFEIPFEDLLLFFAGGNATAVFSLMIDCDRLVESIQESAGRNEYLEATLRSTAMVLSTHKSLLASFLSGIVKFAIKSGQEANRRRSELRALETDSSLRRPIKYELIPLSQVTREHMHALEPMVLGQKPACLKTFIAETLIKESQFAAEKMTPSTKVLRWIRSLHGGDSTKFPRAVEVIVLRLSSEVAGSEGWRRELHTKGRDR